MEKKKKITKFKDIRFNEIDDNTKEISEEDYNKIKDANFVFPIIRREGLRHKLLFLSDEVTHIACYVDGELYGVRLEKPFTLEDVIVKRVKQDWKLEIIKKKKKGIKE